ncbi:hypothetical protein BC827DRAFT_1155206 [Russula dissimulans]|nr:hypothetical protein BC827DRAFT_1155206 [Russula dissimulans]
MPVCTPTCGTRCMLDVRTCPSSACIDSEADAKGIRESARRLDARKEGGERVSRNKQTGIRTQTGPVGHDQRHNRVEGKGEVHKMKAVLEGTQRGLEEKTRGEVRYI